MQTVVAVMFAIFLLGAAGLLALTILGSPFETGGEVLLVGGLGMGALFAIGVVGLFVVNSIPSNK